MRRAFIDFETYYSREYSLSKITPAEYVCDPRFELFGAACAYDDEPPVWLEDYELQFWIETLAAEPTILFAHNMLFDATIASWHLQAKPLLWGCTMSMARGILNSKVRKFSLASLAEYFSLGAKGSAVHNMIGVTRSMMKSNPAQYEAYKSYCCNDLELCRKLERTLAPSFPASEYLVIDTLIRAVTEPMFQLDMALVYQHIAEVQARKWELLQAVQMDTPVDLMSNAKFAACLEGLGVEPPMKISKTTGLETYAFARTDKAMDELAEHEDPRVQALVAARLGHKSTLEESRSHRFISVAQACGNMMPVPLRYSGAHCVPGDVEVLTRKGWVALEAWSGGEIVQYRPDGTMYFGAASRFEGPVVDDWIHCDAPFIECSFTYGHTMPYLQHGTKKFATMEAYSLLGRNETIVPSSGTLQESGLLGETQMRVLAMVQADGHFTARKTGRAMWVTIKKPRKLNRCHQLLTAAGISYTAKDFPSAPGLFRFSVPEANWPAWLTPDKKFFGSWLLDSTEAGRKAFVDELVHWDGWAHAWTSYYYTSVRENAEWVATMCHLVGRSASIIERPQKGNRVLAYSVALRKRNDTRINKKHLQKITPRLKSYCTETETGFWLARSKGRIFVTGNTHRFSGDWKMNMQNLGRESKLRRALVAPPGYKVVAADASQIECRLGAWLADWTWLLDQFRDPTQDPYANYASQLFEKHVVPKAKTPERFVGKQSLLSLQFGASWVSFQRMCRVMGNLELTQEQAEVYVSKYRKLAAPIKQFWALCARLIKAMADGDFMQHKCIFTRFEEIRLPSGLALNYPGLWFDKVAQSKGPDRGFSTWRYGDTGIGLFGGKLMENLCQSLARVIVTDAGTRMRRKHKIHYKMQVHDELIYIVPDEQAEWLRELLVQELSITPVWAPGLPLAAEGKIGINYGEMG